MQLLYYQAPMSAVILILPVATCEPVLELAYRSWTFMELVSLPVIQVIIYTKLFDFIFIRFQLYALVWSPSLWICPFTGSSAARLRWRNFLFGMLLLMVRVNQSFVFVTLIYWTVTIWLVIWNSAWQWRQASSCSRTPCLPTNYSDSYLRWRELSPTVMCGRESSISLLTLKCGVLTSIRPERMPLYTRELID